MVAMDRGFCTLDGFRSTVNIDACETTHRPKEPEEVDTLYPCQWLDELHIIMHTNR